MTGRHVAITGPTAGIGRSAALELAGRGAHLTLFCRNAEKAAELQQVIAAAGGEATQNILMDMASLASVRQAAREFLALQRPLDVLVNNAGIVNTTRRETVDGFEETLAVNHFAPFLLTGLLLPALQQGSQKRIVNVASYAHAFVRDMGFDDFQAENSYKTFHEYGRSKLANILFTRSLARRLEGQGIAVNCLHPGAVATSLASQNEGVFARLLPKLLKPFFRSPDRGAETTIHLCTNEEAGEITGEYWVDCKVAAPKPWARDDVAAEQLWSVTEECVGFRYPLGGRSDRGAALG
jgi:NAD(P)-dependent dehydrogenase (short-subunit alcohol dehydrogenase family)